MSYPKDCQPSTTGVEVIGGLEGEAYCQPFDPDWPHGHVTRDGRKARIICRDVNTSEFPILALVTKEHSDGSSAEYITSYRADGGFHVEARCGESHEDLINAPAPKRKFQRWAWAQEFPGGEVFHYSSGQRPLWWDRVERGRLDGVSILYMIHEEVEEGEGL